MLFRRHGVHVGAADSVKTNLLARDTPEAEIEAKVMRWFQLSGDRDGGRKARQQRSSQHSNENGTVAIS